MTKAFYSLFFVFIVFNTFAQHHGRHSIIKSDIREPFFSKNGNTVIYHLYVIDTLVSYDGGKKRHAMAINGNIPAPTLAFTEGDTAEIWVHNMSHMETTLHWHGLILPNEQDGVPFLTTKPTEPGETHLYKFPIVQNGTYWYHSHSMLSQQLGLYGAFVIYPKNQKKDNDYTVLLSDWTNDNPDQVNRFLHNANDWYAVRKKGVQSYGEALVSGHLKTKVINEWKRMLAMDVSDVYYDAMTTNGRLHDSIPNYKAGDTIDLHIVNGSSSSYFWLTYAGGKMIVVENDGKLVKPTPVDKMLVGTAETYRIKVVVPENKSYELRATSEDRTKATSLFIGAGQKVLAPFLGTLDYFAGMKMMNGMMKMNGDLDDMGMNMTLQKMDMNMVMYPEVNNPNYSYIKQFKRQSQNMDVDLSKADTSHWRFTKGTKPIVLNYNMMEAPFKTVLNTTDSIRTLDFELTGNMNRYLWTINNRTLSESDKILIKKGEVIRIVLRNNTMMRHPMHLHGHFFRVLNDKGEYSPLKTTLDIMPMETDTLEFEADQSGDWFFHCHILYHMMAGMGRIFEYIDSPENPQIPDKKEAYKMVQRDDKRLYPKIEAGIESNGSDGEAQLSNIRYQLNTEWRLGFNDKKGYESESHFGRYIGKMQWLMPYMGWDFRYRKGGHDEKSLFGQKNTKDKREAFCVGVAYTLPLLVVADTRFDTEGKVRVQFSKKDMALTEKLRMNLMWNTDKEWMAGLRYIVGKYVSISSHYDSDMGWGAGLTFNY